MSPSKNNKSKKAVVPAKAGGTKTTGLDRSVFTKASDLEKQPEALDVPMKVVASKETPVKPFRLNKKDVKDSPNVRNLINLKDGPRAIVDNVSTTPCYYLCCLPTLSYLTLLFLLFLLL